MYIKFKKTELVEYFITALCVNSLLIIKYAGMQRCIWNLIKNYQRIHFSNDKFINGILEGGGGG